MLPKIGFLAQDVLNLVRQILHTRKLKSKLFKL